MLRSEIRTRKDAAKQEVQVKLKPSKIKQAAARRLRRENVKRMIEGADGQQRSLAIANAVLGGKAAKGETETLARIAQQEISKRRKLEEEADDAALKEYSAGFGLARVQDVTSTGLAPSSGLVSLPSTGAINTFWYTGPHVVETGKVAAALSKAHMSGVHKALNQEFLAAHQPERQDRKMVAAVTELPGVPDCKKASMCVCKP